MQGLIEKCWKTKNYKKLLEHDWDTFPRKKINNFFDDFLTKINVSSLISSLQLSLRTTHQSGQCTVDTKDPSATAPCWTQKLIVSNPQWSVSTHTHTGFLALCPCPPSSPPILIWISNYGSECISIEFIVKDSLIQWVISIKIYNGCWLTFSDWIHEDVF